MGENEGRAAVIFDDISHGEGLAGAGDTEQGLLADTALQTGGELTNGLRLVTGGLILRN